MALTHPASISAPWGETPTSWIAWEEPTAGPAAKKAPPPGAVGNPPGAPEATGVKFGIAAQPSTGAVAALAELPSTGVPSSAPGLRNRFPDEGAAASVETRPIFFAPLSVNHRLP